MLGFSSKKVVGKVAVELPFTENDIESLIVDALEGGTDHWMGIIRKEAQFKAKPKDEPVSTWVTKLLLEGQEVEVCDIEDRSERWTLTLPKVLTGIELYLKENPENYDRDYWDADVIDSIIQYGLFGKLVYS